MRLVSSTLVLFAMLSVILTTGCSGDADTRTHHVSGTVTFEGDPVPYGTMQFIPSKENKGPAGTATIKDGKFDTAAEGSKGTVGGPHTVVISGFDGKANPDAELPHGEQLFHEFKVEFDVPKDGPTSKDFEVKK